MGMTTRRPLDVSGGRRSRLCVRSEGMPQAISVPRRVHAIFFLTLTKPAIIFQPTHCPLARRRGARRVPDHMEPLGNRHRANTISHSGRQAMRKVKLVLEQLAVDSFETSAAHGQGTVLGRMPDIDIKPGEVHAG